MPHAPKRAVSSAKSRANLNCDKPGDDFNARASWERVLVPYGWSAVLGRLETWFKQHGRADLSPGDRAVLAPSFSRLARDARTSAELCDDLLKEIDLP